MMAPKLFRRIWYVADSARVHVIAGNLRVWQLTRPATRREWLCFSGRVIQGAVLPHALGEEADGCALPDEHMHARPLNYNTLPEGRP